MVGPRAAETPELEAEEARLGHVERLLELASAVEAQVAGDGGASEGLATAAHDLREMGELDPATARARVPLRRRSRRNPRSSGTICGSTVSR